jgi:hypothetical protein
MPATQTAKAIAIMQSLSPGRAAVEETRSSFTTVKSLSLVCFFILGLSLSQRAQPTVSELSPHPGQPSFLSKLHQCRN